MIIVDVVAHKKMFSIYYPKKSRESLTAYNVRLFHTMPFLIHNRPEQKEYLNTSFIESGIESPEQTKKKVPNKKFPHL